MSNNGKCNGGTEHDELLRWIPTLVKEKLHTLSTEQLRVLHYVLGYNAHEADVEDVKELFEGYGYSETIAQEIAIILKRDGMLVMEKPYDV